MILIQAATGETNSTAGEAKKARPPLLHSKSSGAVVGGGLEVAGSNPVMSRSQSSAVTNHPNHPEEIEAVEDDDNHEESESEVIWCCAILACKHDL